MALKEWENLTDSNQLRKRFIDKKLRYLMMLKAVFRTHSHVDLCMGQKTSYSIRIKVSDFAQVKFSIEY